MPLGPGRHDVELRSAGGSTHRWEVELEESAVVLLAFRPPGGLILRRGKPVTWCAPGPDSRAWMHTVGAVPSTFWAR